eukprot:613924-Lingulodinium_polyedra.AAC.2
MGLPLPWWPSHPGVPPSVLAIQWVATRRCTRPGPSGLFSYLTPQLVYLCWCTLHFPNVFNA